MKNTIALIAIAGIATAASAGQDTFSLSVNYTGGDVDATSGATITVDIIGDSSFGTWMLGGEFILSSGGDSMVSGMTWTNAAWSTFNTDGGYAGNGDYNAVVFGQFVLLPAFPAAAGSELGNAIGSFQIDIAAGSNGTLDLSLLTTNRFALKAVGAGGSSSSDDGILSLNGSSINVSSVPAPSAMALLGLGGIAAGRRRR